MSVSVSAIESIIKTLEQALVQQALVQQVLAQQVQKEVVITEKLKSEYRELFLEIYSSSGVEQRQLDWIANNSEAFTVLLKTEFRNDSGNNALHIASHYGFKTVVSLMISSYSVDVNFVNKFGNVPLTYAMSGYDNKSDRCEVVKLLIKAGANVNFVHKDGKPLIHYACLNNRNEIVKLLIDAGADINSVDQNGDTLMHLAITLGNVEVVKHLIKAGIDVNAVDSKGYVPLYYALNTNSNSNELVTLLIGAGAHRVITIYVTPDATTSVPKITVITK